jgi:hypothetical protein
LGAIDEVDMKRIILLIAFAALMFTGLAAFDTGRQPTKAAVLSLAVPGGGQYYNNQYVKCAVFGGAELFLIGRLVYDTNRQNHYYDLAKNSISMDYVDYVRKYNHYFARSQSDRWWLGTVVFLSVMDAYVDAHLYNFEQTKQELHIKLQDGKATLSLDF